MSAQLSAGNTGTFGNIGVSQLVFRQIPGRLYLGP